MVRVKEEKMMKYHFIKFGVIILLFISNLCLANHHLFKDPCDREIYRLGYEGPRCEKYYRKQAQHEDDSSDWSNRGDAIERFGDDMENTAKKLECIKQGRND